MSDQTEAHRLFAIFQERAEMAAARVSLVASVRAAVGIIASSLDLPTLTRRYTTTKALLAAYPDLPAAMALHGRSLFLAEDIASAAEKDDTPPALTNLQSRVTAALAGDVGIILALAGVAETGSVLCVDETLAARLLGMIADSVFVLLPLEKIVPSLDEMGEILAEKAAGGARYMSMVTGPSRTADIERVLTIGVQGPKELHILAISNEMDSGA